MEDAALRLAWPIAKKISKCLKKTLRDLWDASVSMAPNILNKRRPQLDFTSIRQELDNNKDFAFYVGYTARRKEQEDLHWLTKRGKRLRSGAKYKGGRNRPVLQFKDKLKPVIGMQFARKNLKFKSILVYDSPCQLNALDVEEKLQTLLRKHPLGIRLWRNIAKGSKDRFGPGYYKVFIAYSRTVRKAYDKDIQIVAWSFPCLYFIVVCSLLYHVRLLVNSP